METVRRICEQPSSRTAPDITRATGRRKRKRLDGPLDGTDSRHVKTTSTWRLLAVGLGLLVSCSATRASLPTPTSAQELSRSVLVLEKTPDGQVTHSWEPLSGFDLSKLPLPYRAGGGTVEGPIVRAAWNRDCDNELKNCINMCMKAHRGRNYSHASKGSKTEMCQGKCLPAYNDCCKLREQAEALKFSTADNAVAWLKQHHEELLVGTVVVITGVAFVVTIVGSGGTALVLAPAILMVSSDEASAPQFAQVEP